MINTSERRFCVQMRAAPQRERFDPPKVCRGFTLRAQNVHRAAARAIRPTQAAQRVRFACSKCAPRHSESGLTYPKCAEGSLCMLKMRAAPQRERFDPPKVRRGFASRSQNGQRATARAISLRQIYTQAHSKCAPCHSESDSTHAQCAESSARDCGQKCCSEVSLRSVEQNCCSEVSIRSVLKKCCSGVSLIAQSCRSEVSPGSVAHVAEICV